MRLWARFRRRLIELGRIGIITYGAGVLFRIGYVDNTPSIPPLRPKKKY
jgi:hypothetical protein